MDCGALALSIALVLGGAACVWDDLTAALDLGEFDAVIACNDVAAAYPGPLEAAVSLHAEKWGYWMEVRRRAGFPLPTHVLGHHEASRSTLRMPDCVTGFIGQHFSGQTETGSSGLLAVKAALIDLGHDKAVCCGIPMDVRPHFFDHAKWEAAQAHWRGWQQALPQIKDRVRSMSGRTSEFLGSPTSEWLAD